MRARQFRPSFDRLAVRITPSDVPVIPTPIATYEYSSLLNKNDSSDNSIFGNNNNPTGNFPCAGDPAPPDSDFLPIPPTYTH